MLPVAAADSSGLLGRIRSAREGLKTNPDDPHERLVLTRYVQELGTREFKRDSVELDLKKRTVQTLLEVLSRHPVDSLTALDDERFRQTRVQAILALHSLASNDPIRDTVIAALTSVVEDGVARSPQYMEADGAAWALRALTDDGYLATLTRGLQPPRPGAPPPTLDRSQETFQRAIRALARASSRGTQELRQVATSTLREVISIKSRYVKPLFQTGLVAIDQFAAVDGAAAASAGSLRRRLFRAGDYRDALRAVDDFLELRPYDYEQVANKVELLLVLGDYDEAAALPKHSRKVDCGTQIRRSLPGLMRHVL